jgi:hypothetical protein
VISARLLPDALLTNVPATIEALRNRTKLLVRLSRPAAAADLHAHQRPPPRLAIGRAIDVLANTRHAPRDLPSAAPRILTAQDARRDRPARSNQSTTCGDIRNAEGPPKATPVLNPAEKTPAKANRRNAEPLDWYAWVGGSKPPREARKDKRLPEKYGRFGWGHVTR